MPDINSTIAWMNDRKGKVTYSMTYRNGPSSYDCSSAVYHALIQGGFFPAGMYIGNTDSLFNDLERYGWTQVAPNAQGNFDNLAGDVFIWGTRGASSGAAGHTGIFIDADNIDNCNYGYNGITTNNYDWLHAVNGSPAQTFYRFTGTKPAVVNPVDQVLEVGSVIQFSKVYRADDVQQYAGVWQVRTTELCPDGFTWADNGIPTAPLVEVTVDGYRTADQELAIGSLYVIPGKYTVLDLGQSGNSWLVQLEAVGEKFWVDATTLTEISPTDPGKADPAPRPIVPTSPDVPVVVTPPPTPVPVPAPSPVTNPVIIVTPNPIPATVVTPAPIVPQQPVVQPTPKASVFAAFIEALLNLLKLFKVKK